jgi:cellulose biosynthesis protein BcsQ
MSAIGSIDWAFLNAFFGGDHGKIITAATALLVALISLIVAILKYQAVKIAKRERDEANARLHNERRRVLAQQHELEQTSAALADKTAELAKRTASLSLTAAIQHDQEAALKEREQKLEDVRAAFVGQEHDLWCLHPARPPGGQSFYDARMGQRQRQKPVILVANLKGGVGKSTLVANLAAYFNEAGKRVLVIDVDYQGSLSNMLLAADGCDQVSSAINRLLQPGAGVAAFQSARYRFERRLKGSMIVASSYELAAMENRLMIEYLLGDDKTYDDGRYRLADRLLSEEVADEYDIALIDAPPRLTAATVNGFCASTHLLIPTVYDRMSAEAVGTFLHGVQTLRDSLNHRIDLLGVVGTLTHQQTDLIPREQNAKNTAMHQVAQVWGPNFHFFDRHIPRRNAIAEAAGEDIAYYCDKTVRGWFDELGGGIASRLWPLAPAEVARLPRLERAPRFVAAEPAHPAE